MCGMEWNGTVASGDGGSSKSQVRPRGVPMTEPGPLNSAQVPR